MVALQIMFQERMPSHQSLEAQVRNAAVEIETCTLVVPHPLLLVLVLLLLCFIHLIKRQINA